LRLLLRLAGYALTAFGALVVVILAYLGATVVGALLPAEAESGTQGPPSERILLLTTTLHADFAIPVTEELRARFAFLADKGVPMEHPNLRYLVFGWGSRAFYTNTPTMTDIRPGPTIRAVVGDDSVLHILPARDIAVGEGVLPVMLPPGGIDRLVDFIDATFVRKGGVPVPVDHPGYGMGDVFYEANGAFNILRPCNIWAAEGLRAVGLATGAWTPTTWSLELGLRRHSPEAFGAAD